MSLSFFLFPETVLSFKARSSIALGWIHTIHRFGPCSKIIKYLRATNSPISKLFSPSGNHSIQCASNLHQFAFICIQFAFGLQFASNLQLVASFRIHFASISIHVHPTCIHCINLYLIYTQVAPPRMLWLICIRFSSICIQSASSCIRVHFAFDLHLSCTHSHPFLSICMQCVSNLHPMCIIFKLFPFASTCMHLHPFASICSQLHATCI